MSIFVMIIGCILPVLGGVRWGGRYAYFFFELYVRQALIHTFYRDNLIVLFSGLFKD